MATGMSPELRLEELRLAEIQLRSEAEALGNLLGWTLVERERIVGAFQRALRQLREQQALERQNLAEKHVPATTLKTTGT